MDGEVVNYFKVIRQHPEELAEQLLLTPFARDEYNICCTRDENDSDIEKARKFAVRCWQGFGCSNLYKNGFRSSQQSNSPHTTKEWNSIPERIMDVSKRLKNAQIENLPALEIISRYDTKDVFVYLDPPYLPDTRKKYLYRCEMKKDDHVQLLDVIKNHPGRILISGYDNDLYNDALHGWNKACKNTQAEGGIQRIETLWMNYEADETQRSLSL